MALAMASPALAQDKAPTAADLAALQAKLDTMKSDSKVVADTLWVMITGMLVFFMNLGFACVESGFCRAKNCVNILSKNFIVFACTSIGFWLLGWGIMFGSGSPYYGKNGVLMVGGADNSPVNTFVDSLIKTGINDKYGIDLNDAEVAKKYEKVVEQIGEAKDRSLASAFAKNDKGEWTSKFKVSIPVPDKGTFEEEYDPGAFYWGVYDGLAWPTVPLWAKFFFQLVFAGTAATIVSGAVAERIKYHSFILFSFIMAVAIYPVVGHWIWGGGWLQAKGFVDFAGSTQVHSIGGWAALAGVIILGPRLGKYGPGGKINAIPGHNLTAATIGCFVLWFGWFGFNPGSTMAADPGAIAEIAITTNTAAAAATLSATVVAWLLMGKPDIGMTLNGCLAGLVAITAPCAFVSAGTSVVIGLIAGVIVVFGVIGFDRLKVDDPVGATSVHLLNGVFGTICVGLFSTPDRIARAGNSAFKAGLFYGGGAEQLMVQLTGVIACAVYVFVVAAIAWFLLKATVGIRVSADEEREGLDIGEHGNEAYHGFVISDLTSSEGAPVQTPAQAPRVTAKV
jgi:Amt family ammonium transporter